MKIINQIQRHKFGILLTAFIAVVLLCIYFIITGIRKDHSLDLVLQKMELKEEARVQLEKQRKELQLESELKIEKIQSFLKSDSSTAINTIPITKKINNILSKEYAKSKTDPITNFTATELEQFYDNLPDDIEY